MLRAEDRRGIRQPGEVSARVRDALCEPVERWIRCDGDHDGRRQLCAAKLLIDGTARCDDHLDFRAKQVGDERRDALLLRVAEAYFEHDVAALPIAEPAHALDE